VNAPNCEVAANSNSSNALNISGSGQMTTPCAITVGDVNVGSRLHLNKCTSPTTHAAATADPYAAIAAPSIPSGACKTVPPLPATLQPGYYCSGLTINGQATFSPGLYYVKGNLSLQGSANVTGNGVTFFVEKSGTTAISGSAVVSLSAATSGTYAGMLFFGDRAADTSHNNNISGSTSSTLTGVIYYPTQKVTFSGGSSQPNTCTQIVGDLITFSGSTNFGNNCSGTGVRDIFSADGKITTALAE